MADEPERVDGLLEVVVFAAGERAACALDRKGLVWTWGTRDWVWGVSGEDVAVQAAPEVIPGLDQVVAIWAFGDRAFALRSDGSLWAWGRDDWGTLGAGLLLPSPGQGPGSPGQAGRLGPARPCLESRRVYRTRGKGGLARSAGSPCPRRELPRSLSSHGTLGQKRRS